MTMHSSARVRFASAQAGLRSLSAVSLYQAGPGKPAALTGAPLTRVAFFNMFSGNQLPGCHGTSLSLPLSRHPNGIGGIAVIYDTVAALCRAGYDAAILHNSPAAGYLDHPDKPPRYYTYDYYIARQRLGLDGKRARLMSPFMLLGQRFRGGPLEPLRPGADDILVIPEFMITAAMTAFPGSRLGVFVQNPFAFQEAHAEAMEKGLDIRERAEWFLGVSKICLDQFDLLNIETGYHLPVSMKPEDFPFREKKERLITYMPRKRSAEARQIVDVLERRGRLKGYRIEEIDNMPRLDVSDYLQRSQFFISAAAHGINRLSCRRGNGGGLHRRGLHGAWRAGIFYPRNRHSRDRG